MPPKAKASKKPAGQADVKPDAAGVEAPTPSPTTETAKPVETAKAAEQSAPPKSDERKKSEKTERKPSEKAERKPSEKAAPAEASVDSVTTQIADLQVTKPAAKAKKSGGKKSEKGEEAENPVSSESPKPTEVSKTDAKPKKGGAKAASDDTPKAASDDTPKAADPVKSSEVAKAEAAADTEKKKTPAAKKNSERKQSTKAETPKPETKTEEPVRIHAAGGKKIKILAISGSLRKASFNTSLLRAAQQTAPENVEIVIADISGLPLFNQDNEYDPNPAVAKFKGEIAAADAILFSTAEYNYSIPGVLKNAIDVASRPWGQNSWANKPVGLWSASVGGFGGLRAQLALRQSAVFLKLNIYPGEEFMVSSAGDKFDANGLTDAATKEKLTAWIASFSKWVQELPQIPLQ